MITSPIRAASDSTGTYEDDLFDLSAVLVIDTSPAGTPRGKDSSFEPRIVTKGNGVMLRASVMRWLAASA
jgi:hypothetical protein